MYEFNGHIELWDTSNVTDMSFMFYDSVTFNRDISNWDTSSVTNMSYMFSTEEYDGNMFN
jgi:surface protein